VNSLALSVLALTIVLDVAGQTCFKLGLEGRRLNGAGTASPLWLRVATTPLVWVGVLSYAVELGAWLFVLSRLPLSVAVPLASLSYCGVALTSRFVLKEPVSRKRWLGTALVALGAAIVSATL
jgi:drug/metabolite transporter (DMT)-like permease